MSSVIQTTDRDSLFIKLLGHTIKDKDSKALWWDERKEVYDAERLSRPLVCNHGNPVARRGLTTGWALFDEFFTLRKREVTVVSGIPNHGKSEFMDSIVCNSILEHRWKWGIFSPENYPYENHFEKICEKLAGKSFERIPSAEIDTIIKKSQEFLYWVYPRNPTLSSIAELWKHLAVDVGVDAVLLDPWNCVEHKRPAQQSETEYIGEALSGWTDFARSMSIAVFIVAHPTKIPINRDTNMPYMMNGYDISGSANWVNKPDNILIVQRPDFKQNIAHVHVQKVRDQRHTGKRGGVKFNYYPEYGGNYKATEVLP